MDSTGPGRERIATVVSILSERYGEQLSRNDTICRQHANATSWHPVEAPDAVFFAESTDDVVQVVSLCAAHAVPVIPYGTGTSLEAGVNAPQGGISLDLSRMNAILAVNEDDMDCVVQAGVTRKQLNTHLRSTGLHFPIDPGADASIGGMASTRASGTSAVRYGTMKDNVLALTVVMPDGTVCRTGTRARKSSAGYDMTRLFVGAEGTLGVITELTVRLHGIPPAIAVAVCAFPDLAAACNAVISSIRYGLAPARIELLDGVQVRACNAYSKLAMPEKPTLFVEFGGTEKAVAEQVELFRELAGEFGCESFDDASGPDERARLWTARHDVYWACLQLRPGAKFIATDVCVPISRLADCMVETHADIEATGLVAPIVGHVGDGNFHVSIMADTADAEEMARTKAFIDRLNRRAIAMDGTCTGEHGIGQGKRRFLMEELGTTVGYMRQLKASLDPHNIMNPGKIFDR
ncbi:FAD-binding oxidoreductase [Phreatobacter sp. AB_2022a]|uniref:FAD-binding oxidoreductase n=1 Tax=Phreatobacter sp. AB_2022a TaxID=3003134 RepID=UPI0022876981|nr:FAD-linked oxidase C-terminal domain-containing protein [Phreatobacter sp. AB_2022a]MCZ0736838.1 FAD-binding protein [Phreatobacter sp. AB_2022a]